MELRAVIGLAVLLHGAVANYKRCDTTADCTHLPSGVCENHKCVGQQTCRTGADCSNFDNAICHYGMCGVCLDGAVPSKSGRDCIYRGQCVSNLDCTQLAGGVCNSRARKCTCPYLNRFSSDLTTCLKGTECKDSKDCEYKPHSSCTDGQCVCKEGAIESRDSARCLLVSTEFKSPCEVHKQCTLTWGQGAACRKQQCSCLDEFLFIDTCSRIVDRVGDACDAKTDTCYLRDNAAQQKVFCNGTCQCFGRLSPSADRGSCLFKCGSSADCKHIKNSTCADGLCSCPAEHVLNTDNSRCLPVSSKLGSPCEDARQCSKKWGVGGVCEDSKCVCDPEYRFDGSHCSYVRGSGQSLASARSLGLICLAFVFGWTAHLTA